MTDVVGLDEHAEEDVLRLAAIVERRSEHPIARAIVACAVADGISLNVARITAFESRPGRGVIADVDGQRISIGTPELFESIRTPPHFAELQDQGKTTVLVRSRRISSA